MQPEGVFRRRQLPHWDVEGKPIFITACLNGSISAAGLARIREYRDELDRHPRPAENSEQQWERKKVKLVFRLVDELLDHQSPVRHLEDERQAKIVQDAFLHFADERYSLLAFVGQSEAQMLVGNLSRLEQTLDANRNRSQGGAIE